MRQAIWKMRGGCCLLALACFALELSAQEKERTVSDIENSQEEPSLDALIRVEPFGTLPSGEEVTCFTLINDRGTVVKLIDYGAIVTSVETIDRDGKRENITLGFKNLEGYLQRHPYFGATVGRYCNRIANGQFELDGQKYSLAKNNGENSLHGGERGFDRVSWKSEKFENAEEVGVIFTYESPDGEEGYPGTLRTTARYSLTHKNELRMEFMATTDKTTTVNLTNHCYWNLRGAGDGTVLEHSLQLEADQYLPVNGQLIPTGELASVVGTPLDFREYAPIGKRLADIEADPKGYDHCYVVRGEAGELRRAAHVKDPHSGRTMLIKTTQPGIQFYTGNFLDGTDGCGKFPQYSGFCLETQHYPDSPNQPSFPTTVLKPGERFHEETVIQFSVQ